MTIPLLVLVLFVAISIASGFVAPSSQYISPRPMTTLSLTREEDLDLTLQVILEHIDSDSISDGVVDDENERSHPPSDTMIKKDKKKKKKQSEVPQQDEIDVSKLNIIVGVIKKAWEHKDADKNV